MVKKNAPADRSNAVFMGRLIKRKGWRARGTVAPELDRMLGYVVKLINKKMDTIASTYAKNESTVTPKLAQAALQALLPDELRTRACEAGAAALEAHVAARKAGKEDKGLMGKKKKKRSGGGEAEGVSEEEA